MDPLKILFFIQLVVQVFLIGLVILLFVKDRQKAQLPQALDDLRQLLDQSNRINEQFTTLMQQKAGMAKELLGELESTMAAAKALKRGLDEAVAKAQPPRSYTKGDVVRLSKAGMAPLEIAQITGIPEGEVHLMIKLTGKDEA